MKAIHVVIIAALLVLIAEPAFACAVCFDANDQTRDAFLGTTVFLSLLPLGMLGGFALWIYRRARALDEAQQPTTP